MKPSVTQAAKHRRNGPNNGNHTRGSVAVEQHTSPRGNGNGHAKKNGFDAEAFLAKAGLSKIIADYRKDGTIFSQGDTADAVFYIQKGKVKLAVVSPQGKEATVAVLSVGDFAGEDCIATTHPVRLITATALSDCVLLKIGKKEMVRVLSKEQAFSDVFVAFLLARNARIQEDLIDQLFNSSEKRLARILLLFAGFGKDEIKERTEIPPISQETLAEMVGTTRSRVSSFMNKFRRLGFIDYNGVLEVHSSLLSVVLHE